ncbi:uncharacterized protein LOC125240287 [Leguminivora glycinivorella]|uniref:uncharacterized protein LOC125240287 n=1 Tax=Leguminivora glycinivorella TaxID=1035111 RepID=UPI00200FBC83|nr:uncharacterized protein LOC125240287 [Leguminivora glycinivorella]
MSGAPYPRNKMSLLKPIVVQKMYFHPPRSKAPYRLIQQFKDEIIYSNPNCDFLKGESQEVLIVNRMNLHTKTCRTVARCTSQGNCVETTSDNVVAVIGQKSYETVLSALSSVFNEETKVRGILALLSVQKKFNTTDTQYSMEIPEVTKDCVSVECQTDDTRLNLFVKEKQRRRIRRAPLTPYVVTEKVRKFVVNPSDVKKDVTRSVEEKVQQFKEKSLPDLKEVIDEDSNISDISNVSLSSWPSVPGILENTDQFLNQIDKVTDKTLNSTGIPLRDGSVIMIPVKPEDVFHIATPEVLKNVTHEERMKLIWHQAFIDFKLCLEQNEDGYYPLHIAVLHNDVDLVRRQCASLRARHESVDIPAGGLTALQIAVRQNVSIACTNILLQNGADPLLCDYERRSSLHSAAEIDSPQLKTLLEYCDKHARHVLKNNLDFWRPELESKSDKELTRLMYNCISEMFDDQGYSPLMIAGEAAIPTNVALLAARAGPLIDAPSPDCGATALYRAVAKACLHAKETGNMTTTPEKYLKTIEILVEHGADPSIENQCGSCVNSLLTEFNICALSMTIANKMTALRHGRFGRDKLDMILVKNEDGYLENINNVTDNVARTVETGLHAVITVDVPEKKRKGNVSNTDKPTIDDVTDKDKEIEIEKPKTDVTDKQMNTELNKIKPEASDIAMQNNKLGNIVIKLKKDSINDNDPSKFDATKAMEINKVNLKNDARLGNITFKRLSSGHMIAITKTKPPEGILAPNSDRKFNFIKINSAKSNDGQKSISLDNGEGSAKERKMENVVIVENVPVKTDFHISNIAGCSKIAKAKDIVISPKITQDLSKDFENKELSMDDVSPEMSISKMDLENLRVYKKRKLVLE